MVSTYVGDCGGGKLNWAAPAIGKLRDAGVLLLMMVRHGGHEDGKRVPKAVFEGLGFEDDTHFGRED